MTAGVPQLPARYFSQLDEILRGEGLDTDVLLRDAGISRRLLGHAEGLLTLGQVDRFLEGLVGALGRRDIGFDLGQKLRISSHSVIGYAMLTSASVDAALRLMARCFSLITPVLRMRYRRDETEGRIEFDPVLPLGHDSLMIHIEAVLMGTHGILRDLFDDWLPGHRIELGFPPPPHVARYRGIQGATCTFGDREAFGMTIVFAAKEMMHKPRLAHAAACRVAEARCEAVMSLLGSRGRFADWVRMMLREADATLPSLKDLARLLDLSTRTLIRRLQRENCDFRTLQKEEAFERACRLLRSSPLAITRIAHDLGYSDAANFTRAFRRRFGETPSAYRRRCGQS
ncbi:AraC family transcriptional regulator [Zavarzinia aquatilis]|uniref:HTH araC/xylS-type domain-containing protein n=1 Tax=Zavarzinia aquatilis TaxID=2211142 RepID=A0A317EE57_9PROT|nr:AraC family transcriptional regulator [Zavarzinia aquatilis]PWR25328.1 hypothetical protein DKG74_06085 [Zavarzinia aquatilis]